MKKLMSVLLMGLCVSSLAWSATEARWSFDDAEGASVIVDSVGVYDCNVFDVNLATRTLSALHPITDPVTLLQIDNYYSLKDADGYHTTDASTPLPFLMGPISWTFEGYFYATDSVNSSGTIAATRIADNSWWGWDLATHPWKKPTFRVGHPGGDSWSSTIAADSYADNEWNHVAVTWDPDTGVADLYLNHVWKANVTGITPLTSEQMKNKSIIFGAMDGTADGTIAKTGADFAGRFDEFRFTTGTVDPSNFMPLPDGIPYLAMPSSDVLAYWKCDEDMYDTTLVDELGSYDLTFTAQLGPEDPAIEMEPALPFVVGTEAVNLGSLKAPIAVYEADPGEVCPFQVVDGQSWTFECYAYVDDLTMNQGNIVSTRHGDNDFDGYLVGISGSARLSTRLIDTWVSTAAGVINEGQWYHIAYTWDGTTSTASAYLDHVLVGSAVRSVAVDGLGDALIVGNADVTNDSQIVPITDTTDINVFGGSVDEMRYSNKVLTVAEFMPVPVKDGVPNVSRRDFNRDGTVDLVDFAYFANYWLLTD